jgi:hypothetical protein
MSSFKGIGFKKRNSQGFFTCKEADRTMFEIKLLESKEIIDLFEIELKNKPKLINDIEFAKKLVKKAENANKGWITYITFNRYNIMKSALDQLRHICCRILLCPDLLIVTSNIRYDMLYIDLESKRRHKFEQCIEDVEKCCGESNSESLDHLGKLRCQLESVSREVSDVKLLFWRKVNLLQKRLLYTAIILGILLLSSIYFVPAILNSNETAIHSNETGIHSNETGILKSNEKFIITNLLMVGLLMSGALGGLFSAMRATEPVKGDEASYYIQRLLLILRPIIGASAGVIICLLNLSGIVSLTIISKTPNQKAAYLVLAFLAGFSERFFVSQVEKLMNPKGIK